MNSETNEPNEGGGNPPAGGQYMREINCTVATDSGKGLDFDDFKVSFSVRRGDLQTPNSCDVRIYNLSDSTANLITGPEYSQIILSAGYQGNSGLIFKGTIQRVRQGRLNQLDSYVDITGADGDEAYNFAPIFVSVRAGTNPDQLADTLLGAFQSKTFLNQTLIEGYRPNFPNNGCIRGKVLFGMARDVAEEFAWDNNCSWSIQDGELTFIPFTSYKPGAIPVISPTSGLIGVPEQTASGIKIRVLLNPNLKVGQLIKLDSKDINLFRYDLGIAARGTNLFLKDVIKTSANGLYYVMRAEHTGDTRGQDWYTDLLCLSVDASVSTEAVNSLLAIGPLGSQDAIKRFP